MTRAPQIETRPNRVDGSTSLLFTAWLALTIGLGCGSGSPTPDATPSPPDARIDAASLPPDIAPDAMIDAGIDAPIDAMPDAPPDAAPRPTTCVVNGSVEPEGSICDADAGTLCVGGQCESPTAIAVKQNAPYGLVVTGGNVFWTNQLTPACNPTNSNCGQIMTAPAGAMGVTGTILWTGSGVDLPVYLATNGSDLGFTSSGTTVSTATMSVTGGAQSILYYGTQTQAKTDPAGCAFGGSTFYWADRDLGVFSSPIDGSAAPTQLTMGAPIALAADRAHIYWSDNTAGTIVQADLDGQNPMVLATVVNVLFLTVDGHNVYFSDNTAGFVSQVPIGGGARIDLSTTETNPRGLAVDATDIYWAAGPAAIRRAPIGGGVVVTIAVGQGVPAGVALDDNNVYWTNSGTNTVMRLAK